MMAELLTLVYVGDMYFYYRTFHAAYAILQSNAGVGIGSSVEHDTIVGEPHFLQFVDELPLNVTLVILDFYIRKLSLEVWKVAFERIAAIDAWLTNSQKVQVGAIDDLYLHNP